MRTALLVVAALSLGLTLQTRTPAPHPASAILDQYAQGEYDRAIRVTLKSGTWRTLAAFRGDFERDAVEWTRAEGAGSEARRRLIAGTLVLDVAHTVYDGLQTREDLGTLPLMRSQWTPVGAAWVDLKPLIEWACALLRKSRTPAPLEREWFLASIQVFRDYEDNDAGIFVHTGITPGEGHTPGHLGHAVDRFPDVSWFRVVAAERKTGRLASAVAGRHALLDECRQTTHEDRCRELPDLLQAQRDLSALDSDSSVRAEVDLDLGSLAFVLGQRDRAREYFQDVAPSTSNPCLMYLGHFFEGWVDDTAGRRADAKAAYRAALAVVPRAQSASTALASLLWLDGQAIEATRLVEDAVSGPTPVDDPWNAFNLRVGAACSESSAQIMQLRAGLKG